ncbi:MAG TPA: hypothetical protein VEV64_05355, partial [Rhizomicrobium sp.]|nr:hypothetical protein [Rhizomicrobium sp.]
GAAAKLGGVPMTATTSNPFGLMGRALSDMSGGQIGQMCPGQFFPTINSAVTQTAAAVSSLASGLTGTINGSTALAGPATGSVNMINPATGLPVASGAINSTLAPLTTLNAAGTAATGISGSQNLTNTTGLNSSLSTTNPVCANNAQGILQALEQVGLVHMLAEPNLTAVSGETAKFLAGGEFPVPVSRDRDGNITVEFKQFGVSLSFTPVVLAPGRISLQLSSEVSELSNTGAFTLSGGTSTGLSIPALNVRRTGTTIELPSGGSFAVAGLMQHNTKQVIDGFPGVKDLPVLGALFRSRDFADDQTELVVLVSAYLVEPTSESVFAAPTDGFIAPTDPETLLLGRLNATYKKKDDKPVAPQASAPVGFVVR